MSYLVIARKYRPLTFDDLVGQEAIVTTLKNAIKFNRVAHAYLFAGPRGVGKTSMARILSKALNCDAAISESPCNKCDICRCISNGNDIDVIEIDGASNRGIDEIRNIRQNVNYTPSRARYKIYIIDEVHMLTKEAFNALLKTLEEPPSHVKFIFATTSVDKLPETVQSRCQRFDFKDISLEKIESQISLICKKEGIKAEKDVFRIIAKYARGGLRDALSILDHLISFSHERITVDEVHTALGTVDEELMFELTNDILNHDLKNAVKRLEEVFDKGKGVTEFIDQIIWCLRDLLMALIFKNDEREKGDLSEYQIKILANHGELSVDMLTYMIQLISDARRKAKDDRHKRILLEVAVVKLAVTEGISSINDLLDRIENVEKSLSVLFNSNRGSFDDINAVHGRNSVNDLQHEEKDHIDAVNANPVEDKADIGSKSSPPDLKESKEGENKTNYDKESIWNNILTKVQSKKGSLWAVLNEGKLVDYRSRQIVVEFPNNLRIHKERMERPDEKKIIEDFAEAVTGEKVKLKLILSENSGGKDDKKESADAQQKIDNNVSYVGANRISNNLPIRDEIIINNDCVQKAIKIFEGSIVDIRRIEK